MALYGIDVSNWKFGINLDNVPYDIIGFRATQGKGVRDPYMEQMSDMNRRGKNRDEVYYHFVSEGNTVEAEAHNFIEKVRKRLRPQDCICLDWERQGGGLVQYDLRWAQRWCQIVEQALGKRPWIYTGIENAKIFNGSDIAQNNPLWMPHYGRRVRTGGYDDRPSKDEARLVHGFSRLVAWQFTENGHLPGYSDGLDLNEFYIEPGKMIEWAGNVRPSVTISAALDVRGRIGERWLELGGPKSPLGLPTSIEVRTEHGAYRRFQNDQYMLWSPETDAHPSWGEIRKAYGRLDFEHGPMGYPTTDELDTRKPGGKFQRYQGGIAYWSPKTGAHFVYGLILEQYGKDDFEAGKWGFPIGPEVRTERGWKQDFEGGTIGVGGEASSISAPATSPASSSKIRIPTIHESDAPVQIDLRGGSGLGCICMKLTLPLVEEEMLRRGLIKNCIDYYQFGYRGDVAASAGTHDWGGVVDCEQGITKPQREVWAMFGWMMAPRTVSWGWNQPNNEHGHGGMYGCNHRSPILAKQVKDMMAGYNGLVSNRYVDWVKPTQTWQDALISKGLAF